MNIDVKIFNKNPSKNNTTTYYKDHTPWSSRVYFRDAMVQYA